MTEVEFTVRPARDAEEPLYLDSARPRTASSPSARRVPDPTLAADRPLRLDIAREPRPRRRGVPLLLACALTFLLGVGAGVLYLEPPAVLRDALSRVLPSEGTGGAKTAIAAAPEVTLPPRDQAATPVSAPAAPPAPQSPAAPSAVSDLPSKAAPVAEPPAKPRAAAGKHPPRRAAPPKKRPAEAKPAHAHKSAKAPLDLDALAKSLH